MADQMSSIGGRSQLQGTKPEQTQQQAGSSQQKMAEKLLKGNDKVSLAQAEQTGQTYGPIPGVAVGTPYELLRSLVVKTLQEQGAATRIDAGSEILDLQKMTPEQAQELIAEDGYFGVEQTSERIVDFAINAFGKDPAKLEEMKTAIEDGFQQAAEAFAGSLPEISHQTYETIMEKLDAFAGESDAEQAE